MGLFWASFSLRMGQFSNPVATPPRTNEVEVPPPRFLTFRAKQEKENLTCLQISNTAE